MARGRAVAASDAEDRAGWSPAALTDGFASEYELLEWPDWADRVARQTAAEAEDRAVAGRWQASRDRAIEQVLQATGWGGAALLVAAGGSVWRAHVVRRREVERVRRQIARDLHDEVGSNLGSIVLLGRSAGRDDPEAIREDLREVTRIARETAETLGNLVWLLDPPADGSRDLYGQMRRVAELFAGAGAVRFEAPPGAPPAFPLDVRRQLLLAFKEVVHNAARHSRATELAVRCRHGGRRFTVEVADNGVGFDPARVAAGTGLPSVRARAAAAGGQAAFESAPGRGTTVRITVPCRK